MSIIHNPLILTGAVLIGLIGQIALNRVSSRWQTSLKYGLVIYWILLGLLIVVGTLLSPEPSDLLISIGSIGLGFGFMLSGVGQALQKTILKTLGAIVMALSVGLFGVGAILLGEFLMGSLSLSLAVAMLIASLPGAVGKLGQLLIGLILITGGAAVLITTVLPSEPINQTVTDMGMFVAGLLVFIIAYRALRSSNRNVRNSI